MLNEEEINERGNKIGNILMAQISSSHYLSVSGMDVDMIIQVHANIQNIAALCWSLFPLCRNDPEKFDEAITLISTRIEQFLTMAKSMRVEK